MFVDREIHDILIDELTDYDTQNEKHWLDDIDENANKRGKVKRNIEVLIKIIIKLHIFF